MPRKYVKRTRRPRKTTRKPAKRTNRGYVTKAQVARMMARDIETKVSYSNGQEEQVSNALVTAPYFTQINYQINQGLTQEDRIGNKVTHKKATLRGTIHMRDYNSLNNTRELAQIVKLVVFKMKNYQTGINPTYATFFSKILQLGSSSIGLTNTPIDMIRPFNTDVMTVKAVRTFKLGYSFPTANFGSVAPAGTIAPNNDFKYQAFFNIDLTKAYKKHQVFNDNTLDANNDNLFFMVYCCPADGSAFTSTPLQITWDLEQYYEDA